MGSGDRFPNVVWTSRMGARYNLQSMNKAGIDLIKGFEGFSAKPYLCPAGIPTIGYGSTFYPDGRKVTMKDKPITEFDAEAMLLDTLNIVEGQVLTLIKKQLNENQLSALVSFAYNVGIGNLKSSTLLKRVNADPNQPDIREQFLKWKYAKNPKTGKMEVLPGLLRRRIAEANLYYL